jgi:hypothetical protein
MQASLRSAFAAGLVLGGLGLFAFGSAWAPFALELLPDSPAGYWLELVVPFIPMAFVGSGAALFVAGRE